MRPWFSTGRFVLALALALRAAAAPVPAAGKTRTYYLGADEINWNYAPGGDRLGNMGGGGDAAVWLKRGLAEEPPVFHKAVYREYTDATFQTLKPRAPEWAHLGLLGPVIRAEVGDRIAVTLKNNTLIPVSLHPHGVLYTKANEGSRYPDGTSGADLADDALAPGQTYTYTWDVPERAGRSQLGRLALSLPRRQHAGHCRRFGRRHHRHPPGRRPPGRLTRRRRSRIRHALQHF